MFFVCQAEDGIRYLVRSRGLGDVYKRQTPIGRGGQVSFRGLAPVGVAEVLIGLQQRSRADGVKTKEADLRRWCNDLRAQQAGTVADYVMPAEVDPTLRSLVNACLLYTSDAAGARSSVGFGCRRIIQKKTDQTE